MCSSSHGSESGLRVRTSLLHLDQADGSSTGAVMDILHAWQMDLVDKSRVQESRATEEKGCCKGVGSPMRHVGGTSCYRESFIGALARL